MFSISMLVPIPLKIMDTLETSFQSLLYKKNERFWYFP